MDSTSYYYKSRAQLIQRLGGECTDCGKTHREAAENDETLEFHHVDPDKGFESGSGGMNHLVNVRQQVENGVEIELRCKHCHVKTHNDDDHFHRENS